MGTRTWCANAWLANTWLAKREPRTVEQTLHLALAGIAVLGWTLVYTTLMRGVDPPQDRVARENAGTKVSASLTSAQMPSDMPPSAPVR